MKEVATIQFIDVDSSGEALAIVRAAEGRVALCISSIADGDTEVVFQTKDCERLLEALRRAIAISKGPKNHRKQDR